MSPEAQRIKIAEACGWTFITSDPKYPHGLPPKGKHNTYTSPLPDYLNDLNAIHEAVKRLPQNLKPRYFACLCTVVSGAISLHGYAEATEATAAQRCEAFLKTIEKWEG